MPFSLLYKPGVDISSLPPLCVVRRFELYASGKTEVRRRRRCQRDGSTSEQGLHATLLPNSRPRRPRIRRRPTTYKRQTRTGLSLPLHRYARRRSCTFHLLLRRGLIAFPIRSWQRQDRRPGRITVESMKMPSSEFHAGSSSEVQLAGVDDDAIARDYALTRVGREPAREMVMRRLSLVPFFASNTEGALNMLSSRYVRHAIPAVQHPHDTFIDTKQ